MKNYTDSLTNTELIQDEKLGGVLQELPFILKLGEGTLFSRVWWKCPSISKFFLFSSFPALELLIHK